MLSADDGVAKRTKQKIQSRLSGHVRLSVSCVSSEMSPITLPFQAILALISLAAVGLLFIYRQRFLDSTKRKSWWTASLTFFLVYALIVGGAAVDKVYCEWNLNQYDLDGDGFFGENEQTEGQIAAMNQLTHDTGRTFSVISGGLFAFVLALVAFAVTWGFEKYNRLKTEEIKEKTPHNIR